MEKAKSKGVTIHLPTDFVTGNKFAEDAEVKPATLESGIDSEYMVINCFSSHMFYCIFNDYVSRIY